MGSIDDVGTKPSLGEDVGSVVTAIQRAVDQPTIDSARQASHEPTPWQGISGSQEKEQTPISTQLKTSLY
jgi:hypothetical protein